MCLARQEAHLAEGGRGLPEDQSILRLAEPPGLPWQGTAIQCDGDRPPCGGGDPSDWRCRWRAAGGLARLGWCFGGEELRLMRYQQPEQRPASCHVPDRGTARIVEDQFCQLEEAFRLPGTDMPDEGRIGGEPVLIGKGNLPWGGGVRHGGIVSRLEARAVGLEGIRHGRVVRLFSAWG